MDLVFSRSTNINKLPFIKTPVFINKNTNTKTKNKKIYYNIINNENIVLKKSNQITFLNYNMYEIMKHKNTNCNSCGN